MWEQMDRQLAVEKQQVQIDRTSVVRSILCKKGLIELCKDVHNLVFARFCCIPPSYVPYKGTYVPYDGTYGASDQGQTLDVWGS